MIDVSEVISVNRWRAAVITMLTALAVTLPGAAAGAAPSAVALAQSRVTGGSLPQLPAVPRIIGGTAAQGDYPFIAELQFRKNFAGAEWAHHCGGALIAPEWIVTAAHCVETDPGRPLELSQYRVRVGSLDRTAGGTESGIVQAIRHPLYDQTGETADIAIVRLAVRMPYPVIDIAPPNADQLMLLGWGATCAERSNCPENPRMLQQLAVRSLDDSRCAGIRGYDAAGEICADNPGGGGSCFGDSGSPALVWAYGQWTLAGVASRQFPQPTLCGAHPTAYIDAGWHRRWIYRNMG